VVSNFLISPPSSPIVYYNKIIYSYNFTFKINYNCLGALSPLIWSSTYIATYTNSYSVFFRRLSSSLSPLKNPQSFSIWTWTPSYCLPYCQALCLQFLREVFFFFGATRHIRTMCGDFRLCGVHKISILQIAEGQNV
jgi:hypothetical protein